MNLKDQLCSLELAKKLKDLGVEQDSYFYWYLHGKNDWMIDIDIAGKWGIDKVAAFNSDELLELLPAFIDTNKDAPFNIFFINIRKDSSEDFQYSVNYYSNRKTLEQGVDPFFAPALIQMHICDKKPSDTFAAMLIRLIEEGYLKNE